MELEIVNGYSIIARATDRNGQLLILAVKQFREGHGMRHWEFEYVTAWHVPGEPFWNAGHYHSGHNSLSRAVEDFNSRVTL